MLTKAIVNHEIFTTQEHYTNLIYLLMTYLLLNEEAQMIQKLSLDAIENLKLLLNELDTDLDIDFEALSNEPLKEILKVILAFGTFSNILLLHLDSLID